jgi:hypothetical protein
VRESGEAETQKYCIGALDSIVVAIGDSRSDQKIQSPSTVGNSTETALPTNLFLFRPRAPGGRVNRASAPPTWAGEGRLAGNDGAFRRSIAERSIV